MLLTELSYFVLGAIASIMLVLQVVFNNTYGTVIVGSTVVNILAIVYMTI